MYKENIGPVPYDESCQQVGTAEYNAVLARAECQRFQQLLTAAYPPPRGCSLRITSNLHEFGSYMEVTAILDSDAEQADDSWPWLESVQESPGTWHELQQLADRNRDKH